MINRLSDYLNSEKILYKTGVSASSLSSLKIGGALDTVIYPRSSEQLVKLLKYARKAEIDALIQRRFTNTLFKNKFYSIAVICTSLIRFADFNGRLVSCGCGASLPAISSKAAELGLSGFEPLSGIPGSSGASLCGNAGAFGRELCENLDSVTVYDRVSGDVARLTSAECGFSYRSSALTDRYIVLSCELRLTPSDAKAVKEECMRIKRIRMDTQPINSPSLGSVFKKCGLGPAGKLIDLCGLKGRRIGGCEISSKHAGFIVNVDGGDASDYIGLMYLAKKCVFEKFGVTLSPEVKIV